MKRLLFLSLFSLLAILAPGASASAQPSPTPAVAQGEIEPIPQSPKYLKYDDDEEVVGTLARPDDTRIDVLNRFRHVSLIKSRMSFLPEMIQASFDH